MSSDMQIKAQLASPGGWGWEDNAVEHMRYMQPLSNRRRQCPFCPPGVTARGDRPRRPASTHAGMANGLAMTSGCEWHMRMWVRDWTSIM